MLALVYGEDVPRGLADRLQAKYNAKQPKVEVVRLFLFPDCERAVLGGDNEGYWTRELRLHLAWHQMITLLCRRAEVDEVVHHLPLFLSWKKYFYQLLGERCDESKARLEVVARALGMDKRVGQGWLPTVTASGYEDRYLSRWLERQWQYVRKKTNIERVAVWGTSALCEGIFSELARGSDVRLYLSGDTEKANRLASNCSIYAQPKDTL
ncbi:hypothetical protein MXD81_16685, partial [Microbacteriaceae bacterium K1510]|nr:hypothetical protein [Microbacteriaceae bacterium K1510]